MKTNFANSFTRLVVTEEAVAMLGRPVHEIAKMDLREFANAVFDKGYEITVSCAPSIKNKGRLTIERGNVERTHD